MFRYASHSAILSLYTSETNVMQTTKLKITIEAVYSKDKQSVTLPTFPWEYVKFMSYGGPVDDTGDDLTSRLIPSQQQSPSQSGATIRRYVPRGLDLRHQLRNPEKPVTGGNEVDYAFETEW